MEKHPAVSLKFYEQDCKYSGTACYNTCELRNCSANDTACNQSCISGTPTQEPSQTPTQTPTGPANNTTTHTGSFLAIPIVGIASLAVLAAIIFYHYKNQPQEQAYMSL
jgi:hypothetical protein